MSPEPCQTGTSRSRLRLIAPLLAAIAIYLTIALLLARTKAPWCDEGWFGNPAYNLAFRGQMGTSVIDPYGYVLNTYFRGIQERTYQYTPIHMVALAGWFRVFGFSLLSMRVYSILWGIVSICALFYILRRLFLDPRIASLAVLLLSIDFIFLWSAADGRPEAAANALALCALAIYLHFREQRLGVATLASQALLAVAIFTHPNAIQVGLAIVVLAILDDRGRLHARHFFLAAAPYVVLAALWGLYILQSPADFKAQFLSNAAGPRGARWRGILQPWLSVQEEVIRHLRVYIKSDVWSAQMNPWLALVLPMYAAAMIWLFWNRKKQPGMRIFVICVATALFVLTFLNGMKFSMYLHYALPFYDAALAAWLLSLWHRRGDAGAVAFVVGFSFVFLQLATSVMHIRTDEYGRDYLPTIRALERDRAEGKTIIGTAALGFESHFRGFADDWRLGLYSHVDPDIIVSDRSYRQFTDRYRYEEPVVYAHSAEMLKSDYRLSRQYGSFWIYERVSAGGGQRHASVTLDGVR